MIYKYFDKTTYGRCIKTQNIYNKKLAEELHQPIVRKFNKRKVHSPFIDNIWGASKSYKRFRFYYELLTFIANKHGLFL